MSVYLAKARAAWGSAPAWVEILAEAVDRSSQTTVARHLGVSNGLVSAVLSGTYRGDLAGVHRRVAGALMGARVTCPVLGDIGAERCEAEQSTPFRATSAWRVQLWQACHSGCPHAKGSKNDPV